MKIRPLRPLIPASNDEANSLVCPPYDTLSTAEARDYLRRHPNSFMAVIKPEATLPPNVPPGHPTVYTTAATALTSLKNAGRLTRAPEHTFYIYQQQMHNHIQRGLVVLSSVQDYDDGIILRHERTRPDKENDRTKLTDTLSANTGPVFLAYRGETAIDELVEKNSQTSPLFETTSDDHVCHTVWAVDNADVPKLIRLFERQVPVAYIADGHHRAASAARVARQRGQCSDGHAADSDWFLSVLFPQKELKIMSYNRLVKDLNGMDIEYFLTELGKIGSVNRIKAPREFPTVRGLFYVFVGHQWYEMQLGESALAAERGIALSLDSSLLQRRVLQPILGITDPTKNTRIEFVGGIRGMQYLEEQVRKGAGDVAFALCPVTVGQLMEVADSGEIMPPKSTWFEPKLCSGFFVHTF